MRTGKSLAASEKVRRLQTALHAKAKESPSFRFYSLCDKVWSYEVLFTAWQDVRRNGGTAGTDGTTIANIEAQGVDQWLEELARDLKEGTYRPTAVRQVLIPKKQRGKFRPLGIPCIRDRVAQTAAMLILSPIFEADLQPEQYAYRPERGALDAVNRVHQLLRQGHHEVVDADLSDYFGPSCGTDEVRRPSRKRWANAGLDQGMAGNGSGRGRRQRRQTPHEPGAQGKERHSARSTDLPSTQQHLHASFHSGLEGIGLRSKLLREDRQLCR